MAEGCYSLLEDPTISVCVCFSCEKRDVGLGMQLCLYLALMLYEQKRLLRRKACFRSVSAHHRGPTESVKDKNGNGKAVFVLPILGFGRFSKRHY
jgi:hypothetical protein